MCSITQGGQRPPLRLKRGGRSHTLSALVLREGYNREVPSVGRRGHSWAVAGPRRFGGTHRYRSGANPQGRLTDPRYIGLRNVAGWASVASPSLAEPERTDRCLEGSAQSQRFLAERYSPGRSSGARGPAVWRPGSPSRSAHPGRSSPAGRGLPDAAAFAVKRHFGPGPRV
jgi:hypothetical protein